jgi:cytochrome c-type biogenesis protein CcmH/NrfG
LLLKLAMSEDQTHDPAAADDYRRVLAASTRPTTASAAAANNLANLLMAKSDPAGFPEAEKLANQAIAQSANGLASQPYYFDTLGRVYLLESKPDLAADQFAKADQLLPNNPAILIGWADALSRSKKMDQAVVKLQSAQAHLAPPAKLNADIQHELDNVRQAVDKAAQQ